MKTEAARNIIEIDVLERESCLASVGIGWEHGKADAAVSDQRWQDLDEAALAALGERIGSTATTPLFIALRGDLGAGKSVLARAIARAAGVTSPMPSPTFNLVYRYDAAPGRRVAHLDLYRLNHADDVWELGWAELGADDEIVLVEWPERAEALLPRERWDVTIKSGSAGQLRDVLIEKQGQGQGQGQDLFSSSSGN